MTRDFSTELAQTELERSYTSAFSDINYINKYAADTQ